MLAATTSMIRYNKRKECSENAYPVKVATASMLMSYDYYCMSLTGLFTIFLTSVPIWVLNMSPQSQKHASLSSASFLTTSVLKNCLILSNFRYIPIFMLGRYGRLTPRGWPSYPMGWGKTVFCNLLRDCPPNLGLIRYCYFYRDNRKTNV